MSRVQLVLKALPTEDITSVLVVVPHRGLLAHIALQGWGGVGESVGDYRATLVDPSLSDSPRWRGCTYVTS